MKLKNLKLLSCIIAVALAFTFVPSTVLTVLADDIEFMDDQAETDHGYEEESVLEEPIYEETTGRYDNEIIMEPMSSVIDTGISVNAIGQGTSYQILPMGAQYIPEGVYCFENYGNDDYWASILDNSSDANGYAVQTNYTTNPASNFNRAALFKVSRVGTTNRYVIRSMLNNRIGLALVGNVVRTKELPPIDTDVALSDTFVITSSTGGYTIAPYNTTYVICAPNNTNSGTSTAKMHRDTATNAGNRAIWRLYRYTGEARGSTAIPISPTNWDNGAKVGTTYTVSMKPWTTEIDANMPYISIHPDYTDMATVERVNDYTIKVTPKKVGPLGIRTQILRSASAVYVTYKSVFSVVPEIDDEKAVIKNIGTEKYIDIAGSSTSSGAYIQQNAYNGSIQSRWSFEVAYGGFFYIKSLHSNLYIGVDSTNTSLVKQYSTKTDYTLWRFKETSSGNYTLACKATESAGTVLSVPTSYNEEYLQMVAYTNNSDYRDELIVYVYEYTATVNNYFDMGYMVRYSETEASAREKINGYSRAVAEVYLREIGLLLMINDAEYYNSITDQCKGIVTQDNLDTLCQDICEQEKPDHSNRNTLRAYFHQAHTGSKTETNVLWSGHKIWSNDASGSTDYNRSFSLMDSVLLLGLFNDVNRTERSQGVLFHELNHQFGAPDHYHEERTKGDPTTCVHREICTECMVDPRPASCIMYSSHQDLNSSTIICDACRQEMIAHLEDHHKN